MVDIIILKPISSFKVDDGRIFFCFETHLYIKNLSNGTPICVRFGGYLEAIYTMPWGASYYMQCMLYQ
jgi:hypothetical protein